MSGVRCSARLSGERAAPAARDQVRGPARGPGAPDEAARRRARAAERAREVEDSPTELKDKCRRLARALRNAKHLVVYTGAGISTAADIPDYRGPRGVWTRLRRGERVGRVEVARARPTFTHMALTALWARGALKFVVSQNCDGLHVRAGLPRRALAELHGDMFCERCAACRAVYLRAFDTTERTARHRHATRRLCHACGAELRDSIVHFGERGRAAWPLNWAGALRHAARADVVLCLGSSLKVLRRYPRLWRMHAPPAARPALYIVNLQWTPKDAAAALKINARCDAVMRQVARRLRLRVPRYSRARDPLPAHAEPLAEPERHTARRAAADFAAPPSEPSGPEDGDSPSASDSDEELPLRRLADRLRAPPPPPPAPADALRAFRVSLVAGEATILLRAEHAPFLAPPAEPPDPPASGTAALRRFRIARRPDPALPDARDAGSRLQRLLEAGPRLPPPGPVLEYYAKPDDESEPKPEPKPELKPEPKLEAEERPSADAEPEPKWESSESGSESEAGAGSLAAAIIRRAVLVCRASLYPGLHTIVGPPAPAECAWCARHFGVRRCRWYGPPRLTPLASRAWRRVLGRRYLCACCPGAPPAGAPPAPEDGGGWFGKGYRKGRRRRP